MLNAVATLKLRTQVESQWNKTIRWNVGEQQQ